MLYICCTQHDHKKLYINFHIWIFLTNDCLNVDRYFLYASNILQQCINCCHTIMTGGEISKA